MFYLLNWNDEYLDNIIVAAKNTKEEIRNALKERVIERLVELQVADETKAVNMWNESEKVNNYQSDDDTLSVNPFGASILYGGSYTDRYNIVEFRMKSQDVFDHIIECHTDILDAFIQDEDDKHWYLVGTKPMSYVSDEITFQYVPAITFRLLPDNETIAATCEVVILPECFHPDSLQEGIVSAMHLLQEKIPMIISLSETFEDEKDAWQDMSSVLDFLERARQEVLVLGKKMEDLLQSTCSNTGTTYKQLVLHYLDHRPLY